MVVGEEEFEFLLLAGAGESHGKGIEICEFAGAEGADGELDVGRNGVVGADVTLDGKPAGKTPLTLPTVTAGSHAIKLGLAGYNVWSSAIQVSAGQQSRVTASLERRPGG